MAKGVEITVKYDEKFFKALEILPENVAKKAMSTSINEALKKGVTEFGRKASGIYNMNKGEIVSKKFTKPKYVMPGSIRKGKIIVKSRRLTVGRTHFASRPSTYKSVEGQKQRNIRRKKTKIKIKKSAGYVPFKGGFIANPSSVKGKNTMVWMRLMQGRRKPIAPVRTISIAQMLSNKEVYQHVENEMEKKYSKRLEHQINRQLDKIGGKS